MEVSRGEAEVLSPVSPAPRGPGDAVLPHPQDRDGRKRCVAHSAFRGQGVYAIARCCTGPRAGCQIKAGSPAAEGAQCSPGHHVLTGNTQHTGIQTFEPDGRGGFFQKNSGIWG